MLIFMAANFVKALGLNTIIMNLIGEDGMAVFTVCDNVLLIVEMLTGVVSEPEVSGASLLQAQRPSAITPAIISAANDFSFIK